MFNKISKKMKTKIITTTIALIIGGTMAFAQSNTKEVKDQLAAIKVEQQKDSVYYTCFKHPEVTMDKPGSCPKCGMMLEKKTMKMAETKSEKKEAIITYTCSRHPDVISDKPGKCPKCGMDLIEKK